jgi:hypothetical protein
VQALPSNQHSSCRLPFSCYLGIFLITPPTHTHCKEQMAPKGGMAAQRCTPCSRKHFFSCRRQNCLDMTLDASNLRSTTSQISKQATKLERWPFASTPCTDRAAAPSSPNQSKNKEGVSLNTILKLAQMQVEGTDTVILCPPLWCPALMPDLQGIDCR